MDTTDDRVRIGQEDPLGESLFGALERRRIYPRPAFPVTVDVSKAEFRLLNACAGFTDANDTNVDLQTLLDDPAMLEIALNSRLWMASRGLQPYQTVHLLLYVAADMSQDPAIEILLGISREHNVCYMPSIHDIILGQACANGNIDLCRNLLGVYPECVHGRGYSWAPIETAIERISQELRPLRSMCGMLGLLLDHGANPNEPCRPFRHSHGWHLQQAVFKKSKLALTYLLYYGAMIKQSGALQGAAAANWLEGMEILLEHGADVDEPLDDRVDTDGKHLSRDGDFPLCYAVRYNCKEAVVWLLSHGAGIQRSGGNQTAILLAKNQGKMDLVKLIESYGKRGVSPEVQPEEDPEHGSENDFENDSENDSESDSEIDSEEDNQGPQPKKARFN